MKPNLLVTTALTALAATSCGATGTGDPYAGMDPLARPLELSLMNSDEGVTIRAAGAVLATVRLDGERGPSIYPVHGCNGEQVTRGYPIEPGPDDAQDHPHHRSLWFAHGDVDGVDFWHKGGSIQTLGYEADVTNPNSIALELDLSWRDGDGDEVLREKRTYTFAASGKRRWIDASHALRGAGRGVTFGDTKEGTFALRIAPTMRVEGPVAAGTLVNAEGLSGREVWGKRSPWIAASGPVAGADGTTRRITVAMFDHPTNLRHPTWWHARTYGLLAANPFGTKAFEGQMQKATGAYLIDGGETLELRYRVVIAAEELDAEAVEAEYGSFVGEMESSLH